MTAHGMKFIKTCNGTDNPSTDTEFPLYEEAAPVKYVHQPTKIVKVEAYRTYAQVVSSAMSKKHQSSKTSCV